MLQTVEAMIDEKGRVRPLEPINLKQRRRALITILDEDPIEESFNLYALSESALAEDWLRPEEDEAWAHLSELPSL